jgi:small subunit ribosomal protein S2
MTLTLEQMVAAGMHFGHQARKWNPKMKPFIYAQKDSIHIIDLIATYTHLNQVLKFLTESASVGKKILFVGTKKQVSQLIAKAALECDSFYVNGKWLGGQLTNWQTIKLSIQKLKSLEIKERHGFLEKIPKKEAVLLKKEKEKLGTYLNGIKNMDTLPDIVIIIGQSEEINAVRECKKLGIRTITILFIPANDDSISSIKLLLGEFVEAIKKGQQIFAEKLLLKNQKKVSQLPRFKKK